MNWFFWRTRRAVPSPCETSALMKWEALEDRTLLSATIIERVAAVTSSRHHTAAAVVQSVRHHSTRTSTRTGTHTSTRHRARGKPTAST
jgi:hypothetical protein